MRAVAKPLFYAIRYLHDLTHNYGLAIIIVTIGIKLLLAPLAYKSYKSMKDMAAVQPELVALQKKYADDRDRLNKELIKLYKDKKVRIDLFALRKGGDIEGEFFGPLRPEVPNLLPGSKYLVETVVRTLGVGHPLTQGTVDSNEIWVELIARDENGKVFGRSGG